MVAPEPRLDSVLARAGVAIPDEFGQAIQRLRAGVPSPPLRRFPLVIVVAAGVLPRD
ncbi:MAG: hypothetical protein JXA21_30455 [Anaerolineae bacterium]|nr:hypothetical protein [Anaerolineae bacterium]